MDECINSLQKVTLFSKQRANSAYCLIENYEHDRGKTVLTFYHYHDNAIGPKRCPGTFQRVIYIILASVLWQMPWYTWATWLYF